MAARRRERGAGSTQVVVTSSIIAEAMGCRGETTAVCLLGSITKKDCQRMDALKYIAIGSGVFRLPSVGFRLTHRGITVVGNTARRIGGRIETLTRVREIGTQTSLQLQLRDDSILCETSTDDAGILRLRYPPYHYRYPRWWGWAHSCKSRQHCR